jgi:hypothetical protein
LLCECFSKKANHHNLYRYNINIILILVTLEVSRRNLNTFVSNQQKYIIAIEAAILAIFIVEMLARLVRLLLPAPHMAEQGELL